MSPHGPRPKFKLSDRFKTPQCFCALVQAPIYSCPEAQGIGTSAGKPSGGRARPLRVPGRQHTWGAVLSASSEAPPPSLTPGSPTPHVTPAPAQLGGGSLGGGARGAQVRASGRLGRRGLSRSGLGTWWECPSERDPCEGNYPASCLLPGQWLGAGLSVGERLPILHFHVCVLW